MPDRAVGFSLRAVPISPIAFSPPEGLLSEPGRDLTMKQHILLFAVVLITLGGTAVAGPRPGAATTIGLFCHQHDP